MMRRALFLAAAGVALLWFAAAATAQTLDDYPNRPIRIIVPQAAGSGVDLQARVLAQKLSELWGQQVVVEDRPGANAIIGMDYVAKAAPDGYTIVYAPITSVTTNAFIYKKLPYDAAARLRADHADDRKPDGRGGASGFRHQDRSRIWSARAKAAPGKLNYGSFGIGNLTHLMGVLLSSAAGIKMTHVPYKGQTPEMTDLMAGQIPVGFTTMAGATDFVDGRQARPARHLRAKRDAQFPDTPTVVESGYPSVIVVGWSGMLAPAGVPKPIIDKLHAGLVKVLAMPDVQRRDHQAGLQPGEQQEPGRVRALHQVGDGEIPRRHQGRRPRRLAVSGRMDAT